MIATLPEFAVRGDSPRHRGRLRLVSSRRACCRCCPATSPSSAARPGRSRAAPGAGGRSLVPSRSSSVSPSSSSASARSSATSATICKSHERILSIVFGVVTIVLGLFFAGWWPSRGSTANVASTTCLAPRSSAPPCWASSSASDGRRASVRRSARSWARSVVAGRDRAARIDPRVLLLPGTRHPVHRRGAGDRVDGDRVEVAASPPTRHRANRRRPADRDRRARESRAGGRRSSCGSRPTCRRRAHIL